MGNPIKKNLQIEVDACFLYNKLAEAESDATVANVFRQMSAIEKGHAEALLGKMNLDPVSAFPPASFRAPTLNTIGKVFGYDYVLGVLMDTEKGISTAVINAKNKNKLPITGSETNHVKILRSLLENESKVTGSNVAKFESRHRSVGGNALRAAVLGGNDGLVLILVW
jgi:vacuolar iron transporter family protein